VWRTYWTVQTGLTRFAAFALLRAGEKFSITAKSADRNDFLKKP